MSEPATTPEAPAARLRLALYAVVLAALGSWVCFHRLSEGMLRNDEASFAYTSDRMVSTGDWVVPYIPWYSEPHLNAAPLYNWLTNLTAPLFGEGNLKYRAWSAAFGVGCALMVLALGTLLFRTEVGFLAGLLLLGNVPFVFLHGARWCVMDAMLAFFVTAMVACYVRTGQAPSRAGVWWALAGLCLGLAVMTKPPALGGFFFCMLCSHHLLTRRDLAWGARLRGPLAAGVVAALVALPWYAAVYARLGPGAIDHLFLTNSVRRATAAENLPRHEATFYVSRVWESSWGFKAALPAVALGLCCLLLGWNRRAWGILLVAIVPFLFAISGAAEKHPHYAYAVYPFLALAAAAVALAGLPARPVARWACRAAAVAGVVAAGVALRHDLRLAKQVLDAPRLGYPPLAIHQHANDDLAAGRARLVLYRFPGASHPPDPKRDRKVGFAAHDLYYLGRMPHAVVALTVTDLNRLLADGTPTIVILPPLTPREEWLKGVAARPDRAVMMPSDLFRYPVLTFHGAETKLPVRLPE